MNFNKIFKKEVIYDDIKSSKKSEASPTLFSLTDITETSFGLVLISKTFARSKILKNK